jgi:hypothetical protein
VGRLARGVTLTPTRTLFAELAVPLFIRECIVVLDYTQEAAVDRHFDAVVIDKAKLPELIHEMTDP